MAVPGPESNIDSFEVYVLFPNRKDKQLAEIFVTDEHGTDLTIERVKTSLLVTQAVENPENYFMAFHDNATEKYFMANDNHLITDYMNYLQPENYTVIFLKAHTQNA